MEYIGKVILYIIMACCALGAAAAVIRPESELSKSFHDGIGVMATLFVPIVGLMISVPYLIVGVDYIFSGIFGRIGAETAIAAVTFIPADCGGYALALQMASSPEITMMCICVAIMAASTFTFNIPIGLSVLEKKDQPYLALGAMSGILSIPFGVFTSCFLMWLFKPTVRTSFATSGEPMYQLHMNLGTVLLNLVPLIVFCLLLAIGLKLFPKIMVKGFMIFGRTVLAVLTLITAAAIIEYYTGVFSSTVGWGFDPIFGDEEETFRAIELLGSIGMMLSGAFPFVYLVRRFFGGALAKLGGKIGLDTVGSAGLVAGMANAIALFGLVKDMEPKSKVITIAFVVCAGYCLGDWLAFGMNFQPNLVIPIFVGQFTGGVIGVVFAKLIAVPSISKIK
ncbi:MAG: ethanolamine utilization protein EutH [Bacillota bacterium]|jgi:ethanolamine transporter